jgi:alpha-1,2-mannosyltransferase
LTFPLHDSFVAAPTRREGVSGWKALWLLTAILAAMIVARDLAMTRWGGDLSIAGQALWGRDFVNVYTSGSLALHGRLGILYDVAAYRDYQLALFQGGLEGHNYSYPPVSLLYTWLFALVPYPVAALAWLAGTGALFAWAARPYLKAAALPAWIALLAPASLMNLWAGHYGFLIGALWLAAWHHLPRRPVLSGFLIGLMVVKPHLALLLPVVLLYRREWKAIAAAALTVVTLVGLSAALFGTQLWVTYLTGTAQLQASMVDDVGTFFINMMPTVMPSLALLGAPWLLAAIVQGAVAIAAIALLLWKMPRDPHRAGMATATATFLVLPYAFAYDLTVVGLAGLILLRTAGMEGRPRAFMIAAGAAAVAPMALLYLNILGLPVAPLLLGFQLAALLGLFATKPAFNRNSPVPA